MIGPIRNHLIALVKNTVTVAVLVAVAVISIGGSGKPEAFAFQVIAVVAGVAVFLLLLRVWHRTSYTFTDTEILVDKDTVFKKKKTIPYSKIASINVVRSVFDRIAGTSTLQFNVNSGVNAALPEATLVVKKALADEIYVYAHTGVSGDTKKDEGESTEIERPASIISFNAFDIFFHGLFSSSTASLIYSGIFFAYSVYGLFVDNEAIGGALLSTILFLTSLVVPVVSKIVRYFNFSVYRVGDTIYLDHGLFRKYHSEFEVSKINSVKIQRPFFARMMKRSYLQAEVVGINAVQGDVTPTICLMTSENMIGLIMHDILPEFIYEGEVHKQPAEARVPIYTGSIVSLIIIALVSSGIILTINGYFNPDFKVKESLLALTNVIVLVCTVMLMVLFVFRGCVSMRKKDYIIGEEMFTFTNGVVDRTTAIIQYDRVQAVYMKAGPIARRYSLAKCSVSLLSAAGGSKTRSGYFRIDDLNKIPDTMLRRLEDGSYDYNKNVI